MVIVFSFEPLDEIVGPVMVSSFFVMMVPAPSEVGSWSFAGGKVVVRVVGQAPSELWAELAEILVAEVQLELVKAAEWSD